MGRGDKKTKKGKRFAGSYGKTRVRKEKTGALSSLAQKKRGHKVTLPEFSP